MSYSNQLYSYKCDECGKSVTNAKKVLNCTKCTINLCPKCYKSNIKKLCVWCYEEVPDKYLWMISSLKILSILLPVAFLLIPIPQPIIMSFLNFNFEYNTFLYIAVGVFALLGINFLFKTYVSSLGVKAAQDPEKSRKLEPKKPSLKKSKNIETKSERETSFITSSPIFNKNEEGKSNVNNNLIFTQNIGPETSNSRIKPYISMKVEEIPTKNPLLSQKPKLKGKICPHCNYEASIHWTDDICPICDKSFSDEPVENNNSDELVDNSVNQDFEEFSLDDIQSLIEDDDKEENSNDDELDEWFEI
jgi:hypothetical protein